MVKFKLEKEGFQVIIAADGNAGISMFDSENPDLVVTDLMLPFKNGIEILQNIRAKNHEVPVIILSAMGEEESTVLEAFNMGADDFVPKPFNPNELVIRVKRLLKIR